MWVYLQVRYRSGLKSTVAYFFTTMLDWLLSYLWLVLQWGVAGKKNWQTLCEGAKYMETGESWSHAHIQCPCVCRMKGSLSSKLSISFLLPSLSSPPPLPLPPMLFCFPYIVLSSTFLLLFWNTLSLAFFSFFLSFSFFLCLVSFSVVFSPAPIPFSFFSDFYMPFSPFLYSLDVLTFFNVVVNPNTLPLHQLSSLWIFIVISINLHPSSSLTRLFLIVLYTYSVCIYIYYRCLFCFPVAVTELCACRSLLVNF